MNFRPRKKTKTAAELSAELQNDPAFVQKTQEREKAELALNAKLRTEESGLVSELAEAGFPVTSVWDFVNSSSNYAGAVPILLKHLRLEYHPKIREGIARALTIREARGAAGRIVFEELKTATDRDVRWALANALTEVAEPDMVAEIQAMLHNPRFRDVADILSLSLPSIASTKN